jgi:hypothetical protein
MNGRVRHDEVSLSGSDLAGLMRAVLAKGAAFRFRARGCSMSPFIKDGDVVTVCPLGSHAISPGDIVAFARDATDRPYIHRVLIAQGDSYLIQGDNADRSDGFIHASRILGRVSRIERNGRSPRLGLGKEGQLIAYFNRAGLLPGLLKSARKGMRIGKTCKHLRRTASDKQ